MGGKENIKNIIKADNFKNAFEPLISGGLASLAFLKFGGIGGIITSTVVSISLKLIKKVRESGITQQEKDRIERVLDDSFQIISERLIKGDQLRDDGFIDNNSGEGEEIIEEVIQKARNEINVKKAKFLSKFFSNIMFLSGFERDNVFKFLDDFGELRLRQLQLLELVKRNKKNRFKLRTEHYRNVENLTNINTILTNQELLKLYDKEFINYKDAKHNLLVRNWINVEPSRFELTKLGKEFCQVFGLEDIEERELLEISKSLK